LDRFCSKVFQNMEDANILIIAYVCAKRAMIELHTRNQFLISKIKS